MGRRRGFPWWLGTLEKVSRAIECAQRAVQSNRGKVEREFLSHPLSLMVSQASHGYPQRRDVSKWQSLQHHHRRPPCRPAPASLFLVTAYLKLMSWPQQQLQLVEHKSCAWWGLCPPQSTDGEVTWGGESQGLVCGYAPRSSQFHSLALSLPT